MSHDVSQREAKPLGLISGHIQSLYEQGVDLIAFHLMTIEPIALGVQYMLDDIFKV